MQYVVLSLLFAYISYFIYTYIDVCIQSAVRCVVIIICWYLLFYLLKCSSMYVLCSTLGHFFYFLLICYIIYSYVAVSMFCAVRCDIINICCFLLFYIQLCISIYVLCSKVCYYYYLLYLLFYLNLCSCR